MLKQASIAWVSASIPVAAVSLGGRVSVIRVSRIAARGIKFSEASFRKYVQQGLLPRSKRVGRKGKHRGSLGVYPAKTIRRINSVKQLMADGYTIEEIQGQFLLYTDLVEGVAENLAELWTRLAADVSVGPCVRFGPGVSVGAGSDIRAFCDIEGARIGRDTIIGPFARIASYQGSQA